MTDHYEDRPPERLLPEPGDGPYEGPEPGDFVLVGSEYLGVITTIVDEGADRPLLLGLKVHDGDRMYGYDIPEVVVSKNFGRPVVESFEHSVLFQALRSQVNDAETNKVLSQLQDLKEAEVKGWHY